jgi:hypothetical protein
MTPHAASRPPELPHGVEVAVDNGVERALTPRPAAD